MATLYRCRTPTDHLCPCGRVARELRRQGIELSGVVHAIAMDKTIRDGAVKPMLDARYGGYGQQYTLFDAIGAVWINILVMLMMPIIALVVSYVKFLRMDVR